MSKSPSAFREKDVFLKLYNCSRNNLNLLFCGNKGGNSTKLLLQFDNVEKNQSLKIAKLLGVFEGAKETRECIEKVFGPILSNALGLLDNIASLKLPCQTPVPRDTTRSSSNNSNAVPMCTQSQFANMELNLENRYRSRTCKHSRGLLIQLNLSDLGETGNRFHEF